MHNNSLETISDEYSARYGGSTIPAEDTGPAQGGVRLMMAQELGEGRRDMGGSHSAELQAEQVAARSFAGADAPDDSPPSARLQMSDSDSDSDPDSPSREGVALKAFNNERAYMDDEEAGKRKKVKREKVKEVER